jgi:hypothetical protein
MQLLVEIQGVADLLQGDESFTSAAGVWLVADSLRENRDAIGLASEQAQFTPSAWRDQTKGEVKFAGVDDDLVCVKDLLIFHDAPFFMANDAGAAVGNTLRRDSGCCEDQGVP